MNNPSPPSLLPNGLIDLLSPMADLESHVIHRMMSRFARFGYQRVKPPLVEFEETLLADGPGQTLTRQTFRLMDPLSQRMMGVRADMTAQIARIAATRLKNNDRPLRLSYAGDVLRVNGTQLRPSRQLTQVGCELIGDDTHDADCELALIASAALYDCGLKDISIDLCVPALTHHLFEEMNTPVEIRADITDLIQKRDKSALKLGGDDPIYTMTYQLLSCEGTLPLSIKSLSALSLPPRAQALLQRLLEVASDLRTALDIFDMADVQITLDPLERRGFDYQSGVSFTIFSRLSRLELGRGGRYSVTGFGETGNGFTLYIDSILPIVPTKASPSIQEIKGRADWSAIKRVQDDGHHVIRTAK